MHLCVALWRTASPQPCLIIRNFHIQVDSLCCLVYTAFITHYTQVMIRDADAYQIPRELHTDTRLQHQ